MYVFIHNLIYIDIYVFLDSKYVVLDPEELTSSC